MALKATDDRIQETRRRIEQIISGLEEDLRNYPITHHRKVSVDEFKFRVNHALSKIDDMISDIYNESEELFSLPPDQKEYNLVVAERLALGAESVIRNGFANWCFLDSKDGGYHCLKHLQPLINPQQFVHQSCNDIIGTKETIMKKYKDLHVDLEREFGIKPKPGQ